MKRVLLILICALLAFVGCKQKFPAVEGRVVDATIHSVTLADSDGENVNVSTLGTDPLLVPGVLPGDVVRITYEVLPDGETLRALRLQILEPSAYRVLPGIWRDCDAPAEVGLVLAEDGSAQGTGLTDGSLLDWSLDDGSLVLGIADAPSLVFAIDRLSADSLVVHSEADPSAVLAFSRQK